MTIPLSARVKRINTSNAAERKELGIQSLGVRKVLAQKITDRPKPPKKKDGDGEVEKLPTRKLRPHLACREPVQREKEISLLKEFRLQYRDAMEERNGDKNKEVVFPKGTYRLRGVAGVVIGKSSNPMAFTGARILHLGLEGHVSLAAS